MIMMETKNEVIMVEKEKMSMPTWHRHPSRKQIQIT